MVGHPAIRPSCKRQGKKERLVPEVDLLLSCGPSITEQELQRMLSPSLQRWRRRPQEATKVLASLATMRRISIAGDVLTLMQKNLVECNVFHFTAYVGACEKSGQWTWAVRTLKQMQTLPAAPNAEAPDMLPGYLGCFFW